MHSFKVEEGHVIKKAFKGEDGTQYYYIKDVFNTFASRALDALAIYEQWAMRCTSEYLRDHAKAVEIAANTGKLTDVARLNGNLIERLNFAIPTQELIYQFAAVVYFDENESPYRYDPEYGKEKIAKWKKDLSIEDFFFKIPIKELIPFPKLSKQDLAIYSKIVEKINTTHLKQISDIISGVRQNKGSLQASFSPENLQQTTIS